MDRPEAALAVTARPHHTPDSGWAGDVIPFHDGSRWHVFYLRTTEQPDVTSWHHLVSDDLLLDRAGRGDRARRSALFAW